MDRYTARINLRGNTQRERVLNRCKDNISNHITASLSYKEVKIDGVDTHLIVDSGTKPYYKIIKSVPNENYYGGEIVDFANSKWLVVSADSDKEIYTDGEMHECTWNLKWQNSDGDVIQTWAVVERLSSVGIDEDKVIKVGANQLNVLVPYNSETIKIRKDKRFFIDNNFENPTAYKVELTNTTAHVKNGHGYIEIIMKETQTSPNDRPDLMLCDYVSPTTPPDPGEPSQSGILCTITYKGDASIIVGGNAKTFTAVYTDADGNDVSGNYNTMWSIVGSTISELSLTSAVNSVKIKCAENDKLINTAFTLKTTGTHNTEAIETTLSISLKSIY